MKILAILGSPRKGNTYNITRKIEEQMKQLGDIEFNYLFLKDIDLKQCRGCFICVLKGEEHCPLKDTRDNILKQMLDSDGVIFASPVYVFSVTALIKNFIERLGYLSHRPCFFDQTAIAVSTSSGGGLKETLKYLESISRSWGFNFIHKLGVVTHPLPPSPKAKRKIEKEIEDTTRKFYQATKTKRRPSPSLGDLLQFRIMRANAILAEEDFTADIKYFKEKGLMNKDYYIDINVNPLKNIAAQIIERIAVRTMKENLITEPTKRHRDNEK